MDLTYVPNLLVILMGVFPVVILASWFYLKWKRRRGLAQLAASMGLVFSPGEPDGFALGFTGLEIFSRGCAREAQNLMQVQARLGSIKFFDYSYHPTANSNAYTFTMAIIPYSGSAVPVFDLKPEGVIYKIGEVLGFKDIDLPAYPLFSRKYRLTGPDAAAVKIFFTAQRAAWFERHLGLRVQGARGNIVIFKYSLAVSAWPGFIEEVKSFAAEVL